MNHLGTKQLITPRLLLRKFTIDDCSAAFKNWMNDERVTKYVRWNVHQDIEVTKNIISSWVSSYSNHNFYQWAICIKDTNELIGSISVVHIDEVENEIEIGYCLSFKYWNNGFTTEALQSLINFFFNQVEVKKIKARHDYRNIASGKVMIKCNMNVISEQIEENKHEPIITKLYAIEKG